MSAAADLSGRYTPVPAERVAGYVLRPDPGPAPDAPSRWRIARIDGRWRLQKRGLVRRWRWATIGDREGFADLVAAVLDMRWERWRRNDRAYFDPVPLLVAGVTVPAGAELTCDPDQGPVSYVIGGTRFEVPADSFRIVEPGSPAVLFLVEDDVIRLDTVIVRQVPASTPPAPEPRAKEPRP